MAKGNIRLYTTESEYLLEKDSFELPNVSFVEDSKIVFYNPFIKNDYLKLKYNVTSTSEATQLIKETAVEDLEEIIIDGNSMSPVDIYIFNTTGMHEVWFKFIVNDIVRGFGGIVNLYEIIEIPTDITALKFSAFYNSGLVKANLKTPNGKLISLTDGGLGCCYDLEEIILPDTITEIINGSLCDCKSLKQLKLPNSLTWVGGGACTKLESISELIIPNSVTVIQGGGFAGANNLERLVLSSSMKEIQPGNWNEVGTGTKLKDVTIPEGVEIIWGGAFVGCIELKHIIFPTSIKELKPSSFWKSGLNNITFLSKISPTISAGAFAEVAPNGTVYVPYGCTEEYSYLLSMEDGYLGAQGWTIQELPKE